MANYNKINYETIKTDEQIQNGNWEHQHMYTVDNATTFSTDLDKYNEEYNKNYNTMSSVGLVHAITYYSKHQEQAIEVKDSTEYPFAARAASVALFGLFGSDYSIDSKTRQVVASEPLWGGSKRFKKKSRRRRNRKTTRRRRRKY